MMGQETYQIVGTPSVQEISSQVEITDEDVQAVVDQTQCTPDAAREMLMETNGDIAAAILNLSQK